MAYRDSSNSCRDYFDELRDDERYMKILSTCWQRSLDDLRWRLSRALELQFD